LLLLGEPTANLDLDSVGRLASALVAYRKAFVVVSHDGRFQAGIGVRRRPRVTGGKPGDAGSVRAC
jgi:ATPase subunit of ABC transporter with duplicated ATPase domains